MRRRTVVTAHVEALPAAHTMPLTFGNKCVETSLRRAHDDSNALSAVRAIRARCPQSESARDAATALSLSREESLCGDTHLPRDAGPKTTRAASRCRPASDDSVHVSRRYRTRVAIERAVWGYSQRSPSSKSETTNQAEILSLDAGPGPHGESERDAVRLLRGERLRVSSLSLSLSSSQ